MIRCRPYKTQFKEKNESSHKSLKSKVSLKDCLRRKIDLEQISTYWRYMERNYHRSIKMDQFEAYKEEIPRTLAQRISANQDPATLEEHMEVL